MRGSQDAVQGKRLEERQGSLCWPEGSPQPPLHPINPHLKVIASEAFETHKCTIGYRLISVHYCVYNSISPSITPVLLRIGCVLWIEAGAGLSVLNGI